MLIKANDMYVKAVYFVEINDKPTHTIVMTLNINEAVDFSKITAPSVITGDDLASEAIRQLPRPNTQYVLLEHKYCLNIWNCQAQLCRYVDEPFILETINVSSETIDHLLMENNIAINISGIYPILYDSNNVS